MVGACGALLRGQHADDVHTSGGTALALVAHIGLVAVLTALAPEEGSLAAHVGGVVMLGVLGAVALWAVRLLGIVGRKMRMLRAFSAAFRAAVVFVWVSTAAEAGMDFLVDAGMAEHAVENAVHVFFYAGMLCMYLAFDLPHHFGGLYAEVREHLRQQEPKEPNPLVH